MSSTRVELPNADAAAASLRSQSERSNSNTIGEIRPLTGLRGLAALYVVTYHHRIGVPFSNPLTTFLAHGYLAVDLFFVLSGFVMALTYGSLFARGWSTGAYVRFLGRRAARIYPLYFVATLAAVVLIVAGALEAPRPAPLGATLALNLLVIQAWGLVGSLDGPAWSISAEFAAYLTFPILLIPTIFRRPLYGWIAGLVSAGFIGLLCMLPPSIAHLTHPDKLLDLYDPHLAFPVLRCLPEFVLGLLAYRVARAPFGRGLSASVWHAPAICLLTLGLMAVPKADFLIVLLFPLVVVSIASERNLPGKLLASPAGELLGTLSYSIYLTHELVVGFSRWLFGLGHAAWMVRAEVWAPAISVVFLFPIAFVVYHTIEAPGRRALRAFFDRVTERSAQPA